MKQRMFQQRTDLFCLADAGKPPGIFFDAKSMVGGQVYLFLNINHAQKWQIFLPAQFLPGYFGEKDTCKPAGNVGGSAYQQVTG